jgi:hypothetical protein
MRIMRSSLLAALLRTAKLSIIAAGLTLASCDSPADTSVDAYALATVNNQVLPAPYPDPAMPAGVFQVTAGELVLRDDGTFSGRFTVACAPSTVPGDTCHVDDPEQILQGSYSREEGWLELGGGRYPAEFTDAAVLVRIFVPAYMGYFPEYNLRFTR